MHFDNFDFLAEEGDILSIYSYSILLTVVDQKSLAKAAAVLSLTPSAVSHAIAKLEEEFGFPLFNRSRNRLVLTSDGEQIIRFVRNAVNASNLLEQKAAQIRGLTQGELRIGVINSIAVNWLPDILMGYRKEFPSVHIQVVQSGYNRLIQGVSASQLDIAFVSHSSIRGRDTAFQFIPLHKDRLMCVSPKDYRPAGKDYVTTEEIRNMNLIFHEDGDEIDILTFLKEANLENKSDFSIFNDQSLVSMVKCGFGHSIMPELSLKGLITDGVSIYPITPMAHRELGLITAPPKYLTPAAQKMIQHIQQYAIQQEL